MATNFVQPADKVTFTAAANLTSGVAVILGSILGVALHSAANGATCTASIEGGWQLPKAAGAITVGQKLIWDHAAGNFKTSGAATGDILNAAVAISAQASGDAVVVAKLTPGSSSVSP